MSDIQDEAYSEAMAEIERLKAENTLLRRDCAQLSELNQDRLKLKELSEQSAFWANHENAKLKQLIGELADALSTIRYDPGDQIDDLIRRAREAVK